MSGGKYRCKKVGVQSVVNECKQQQTTETIGTKQKKTIATKTVYGPPYEVTNYYIFTTNPNVDSCKRKK
jgi:hypothetical protein